jgi:hypothetical protein
MKIQVTVEVEVPDGATHYIGDLLDGPAWLKCTQIGVVGDHWWFWSPDDRGWFLLGFHKPHWAKEIP